MNYNKETKAGLLLLLNDRDQKLKNQQEQMQALSIVLVVLLVGFLLTL
jgi:hypothetical protein